MTQDDFETQAMVFEAGRAIRPYLDAIAEDEAQRIDTRLAEILSQDDAAGAAEAILELLDEPPATHDCVSAVYRLSGIPPEVVEALVPGMDAATAGARIKSATLGGGPPAGDPLGTIPGRRHACPRGDYVWYRRDAAEEVPGCPTHRVLLVPSPVSHTKD